MEQKYVTQPKQQKMKTRSLWVCSDKFPGDRMQTVLHNTAVPEESHFNKKSWLAQEESNSSSM
jgi:hypothetical protein